MEIATRGLQWDHGCLAHQTLSFWIRWAMQSLMRMCILPGIDTRHVHPSVSFAYRRVTRLGSTSNRDIGPYRLSMHTPENTVPHIYVRDG